MNPEIASKDRADAQKALREALDILFSKGGNEAVHQAYGWRVEATRSLNTGYLIHLRCL